MRPIIQLLKRKARVNFFDLLILFLLLLTVGFFIYQRLQRQSTWVQVRLSVENPDWWYRGSSPNYWYAQDLQVGDVINDGLGNKMVEIVGVDNYDNYGPYRDIYVDLLLRVDYNKKRQQYLYEFKPLVVGSALLFNFSNYQLRGTVIGMGSLPIHYFERTVKLELKYAQQVHKSNPFFVTAATAAQIKAGQQAYDALGNVVAEIIEVRKHPAAYYEFSNVLGHNVLVTNPDFYDVELVVKLKAFEAFGVDYFVNKAALKVGNGIWLQFPEFALDDMRIIELFD